MNRKYLQDRKSGLLQIWLIGVFLVCGLGNAAWAEDVPGLQNVDEVVRQAISHSYVVQSAKQQEKSAEQGQTSAFTDMLPRFQANYGYTWLDEQPYAVSGGMHLPMGHDNQYSWDVTLVQPLFTGFALQNQYAMAKLQAQVKKWETRQNEQDVTRSARTAYYNVLLAKKMLGVATETVAALAGHEKRALAYYQEGLIPKNDLLRSQVALADARQREDRAKSDVTLAIAQLNLLLGNPMGAPANIADIKDVVFFDQKIDPLIEKALASRPILHVLRLSADTLAKAVEANKSAYYPHVNLIGQYSQTGDNPAANENDYGNRYNSTVSVMAQWDFFQWGKTRADVAAARHQYESANQQIRALEDRVRLEVQSAYLDVLVAQKNIDTANRALGQARENWRITGLQYEQNVATSSDVLDAQADLSGADSNYYRSLYGFMSALAGLERTLGTP